jgi:hypothetical protein
MYELALCLPSVGQPQGLPVPHEIPKTRSYIFIQVLRLSDYQNNLPSPPAPLPKQARGVDSLALGRGLGCGVV